MYVIVDAPKSAFLLEDKKKKKVIEKEQFVEMMTTKGTMTMPL
jgi:hypothetical protein